MKEIIIKINFDDEDGYKGHNSNTTELIINHIKTILTIDLEQDDVIKKGWTIQLINETIT